MYCFSSSYWKDAEVNVFNRKYFRHTQTQYFFLAMPRGMQDLSTLIRDGVHDPCSESAVLTTGLTAKSPRHMKGIKLCMCILRSQPSYAYKYIFKKLKRIYVNSWYMWMVEYRLEKAMTPHSSTLAWKIPRMEEPGGLQSMGSLRIGYD